MFYLLCPRNPTHLNIGKGIPNNDWACAWCGAQLTFNPFVPFVNRQLLEQAREAVYSPRFQGSQVSPVDLARYGQFAQQRPEGVPPPPERQPTPIPMTGPVFGSAMQGPALSFADLARQYEESVRDPPQVEAAVVERRSQEEMYGHLEGAGYLFLRRNGSFGAYKRPVALFDAEETVPEPGMVKGGYTKHIHVRALIVGRGEDETPRGKGTVTYPDYVATKDGVTYSIELKTPREHSMGDYLSNHFYRERIFTDRQGGGRSILLELEARRTLTPSQVEIVLLFDVRNIADVGRVIADLKNSILHAGHKTWWETNINGVMFYSRETGLTRRFTIEEVVREVDIRSKGGEQKSIRSYFAKK
ncbi:MAG: hypothetical protein ABW277_09575 [Longimicrobiaceae bacterium]